MKFKTLAVLLATVFLALVLVGCGGSGSDSGSGDDVGGMTTYAIGVASPYTQGAVSIGQGIKRGAQLAIDTMNASDEAKNAGIQFKMVEGDDMGDPKTAVTVANTLVSNSDLIGVVGHYNSGCSIPASKVYSDAGVVMVSPGSTNPDLTKQGLPGIFRTCATDDLQGPAAADFAKELGFKTAAVVDDSTPYGEGLAAFFTDAFESGGGEIVLAEKTQDKDSDFNALVTKIKAANPDIVFYSGMAEPAGALFGKQLHEVGVTAPVMGGDGMQDAAYIKLGGSAVEGDYGTNVGYPIDKLPAGQKFVEDYAAKFTEDIGAFDAYAYDAAFAVMKAAIKASDNGAVKLTSPAGREALLAALENIKFDGVTGEISFDANGDTNNKVISLYRVENGVWIYVDPNEIN